MGMPDAVARDLLEALNDENLYDMQLVGADGALVPAARFVLASRCRVLKRMLYGNFREAKSSTIYLLAYESTVLRAVVEFCNTHAIRRFAVHLTPTEASVRHIVQLSSAADYLELPDLQKQANELGLQLMAEHTPLACAVWDEAMPGSDLHTAAQQIIEGRPYVALDIVTGIDAEEARGGGVECIRATRIVGLFSNTNIAAGELFMYQMLERWFQHAAILMESRTEAVLAARRCAKYIRLQDIEPRELLNPQLQYRALLPRERIFAAIAKQALRASQNQAWCLRCRGPQSTEERILVEGAGTRDANGIYYRIPGLTTGDLYTKREVSCGQQNVYTLSRTSSKNGTDVECRIFCSQLLTYNAVPVLQRMQLLTPNDELNKSPIRPVLQIQSLQLDDDNKMQCVTFSDGRWYMPGTISESLVELVQAGKIGVNSVIKLLDFSLHREPKQELAFVHVKRICIISASPGQRFGNPQDIQIICKNKDKSDFARWISPSLQENDPHNGLKSLYSCHSNAEKTKIPISGWQVEGHGCWPSPQCTLVASEHVRSIASTSCSSSSCSSLKSFGVVETSETFREQISSNGSTVNI